ncbi:unnamed protein product [Caenorhabditis angaria]|uniref:Uncharacterized protein n=1 Tax=Caenorhabditis angaria TaxID=860376 RepID=A0A9P1MRV1_9PELO|nr:unnamed protein product [Caenorhabditis angaria]
MKTHKEKTICVSRPIYTNEHLEEEHQFKRNNDNWRKLNSLWGKRSVPDEILFKRAEPAQWQMASGLWGRK